MSKAILADNGTGSYFVIRDNVEIHGAEPFYKSKTVATVFESEEAAVMAVINNEISKPGQMINVVVLEKTEFGIDGGENHGVLCEQLDY